MPGSYTLDTITICSPDIATVQHTPGAADVAASRDRWLVAAQQDEQTITYLSIYQRHNDGNVLVGQIFLHDYHTVQQEALVGYHLFQPKYRGQGIGTLALRLLLQYVLTETQILRLTIITDLENRASQRIAEKCGFVYTGPAREGLPLICYTWQRDCG
jgi:RimJ/RimL family protein N-acetyltransferase